MRIIHKQKTIATIYFLLGTTFGLIFKCIDFTRFF